MSRLASGLWVQAYLRRLEIEFIPAYVVARGDETAGAILVKLSPLDGTARLFQRVMAMDGSRPWDVLTEGPEPDVDAAIARQRGAALATRGIRDFEGCGIELHDPWRGA